MTRAKKQLELDDFVDGAKFKRQPAAAKAPRRKKLPHEKEDPEAPTDRSFRYRTNAYERELMRYVAALRGQGESMQTCIRTLAREAALAELKRRS